MFICASCCMQVGRSDWSLIPEGPPWAVDAWGLGCLLQETFSGKTLARAEDLRQTGSIPPAVLQVRTLPRSRGPLACRGWVWTTGRSGSGVEMSADGCLLFEVDGVRMFAQNGVCEETY